MLNDFFNLIFPKLCILCDASLLKHESTLCLSCQIDLPKTNYHLDIKNPINKIFWGREKIEMASAFYFFKEGNKIQKLLHQLKYKGDKDIGLLLGELCGYELNRSGLYDNVDFIVPVPLHVNKMRKRGYNQSNWIAKGLSSSMKIPVKTEHLYRKIDSETQVRRNRYDRWENVSEIFGVKDGDLIRSKRILLIDDIVTTGATIEACARNLKKYDCEVYVFAVACA